VTNLEILQALVFEPRKAFAELAERPKYWFPLLLLLVATLLTTVWYTSKVDLAWAADRQIHHSVFSSNLSEDQIQQAVKAAEGRRGLQISISVIAIAIVLPVVVMVAALYNQLVGKMVGFERTFRQWFAFVCWCAIPSALAAVPAALVLATTDTSQIGQEALKPLSLNSLFFHRAIGEPGFSLFTNFDLFQVATMYLSLVGLKVWSGRSWLFCVLFIGIPWLLIYGPWAWFSLR
jgi:hypothetical protein